MVTSPSTRLPPGLSLVLGSPWPRGTHDQSLQPVVQVAVKGKLFLDEACGLLQRWAGCPL